MFDERFNLNVNWCFYASVLSLDSSVIFVFLFAPPLHSGLEFWNAGMIDVWISYRFSCLLNLFNTFFLFPRCVICWLRLPSSVLLIFRELYYNYFFMILLSSSLQHIVHTLEHSTIIVHKFFLIELGLDAFLRYVQWIHRRIMQFEEKAKKRNANGEQQFTTTMTTVAFTMKI